MSEMKISVCVVGPIETNCWLILNPDSKEIIVVDRGDEAGKIIRMIRDLGGTLVNVLLTHGHHDHILGLQKLLEEFPAPVFACAEEVDMLSDPRFNMSVYTGSGVTVTPDRLLKDGEEFQAAGFGCRMLHTPGHSKGSCCYYFEDQKVLFSGDTLFRCSVGRSDLYGGSEDAILQSLHRLLRELPGETQVFPGHGPYTTIEFEKRNNPFV